MRKGEGREVKNKRNKKLGIGEENRESNKSNRTTMRPLGIYLIGIYKLRRYKR